MFKFKRLFLSKEIRTVFVLIALTIIPLQGYANTLIVGLASKSSVKREAVREVFQALFPEYELDLVEHASGSEIAEQPVGKESGILGAKNRLKNGQEGSSKKMFDYWISIENYIEPALEGFWVDRAVVITQKHGKPVVTELSREVRFEAELAEAAQLNTPRDYQYLSTGFSVTAGANIQIELAKKGQNVAKDDWHSAYGGVSRKDLIKEALFRALIRSAGIYVPSSILEQAEPGA
ncbi:MAG: DUF84 family protein [Bdellovibrionia bacterium]